MDLAVLSSSIFSLHPFTHLPSWSLLVPCHFFSVLNTFHPGRRVLQRSPQHELLRVPLLLVFPSFVVPRFFSHGLAKEVSSVQPLVTHRACLSANRGKSHLRLVLPQHMHIVTPYSAKAREMSPCLMSFDSTSSDLTFFNRCPILNSSHSSYVLGVFFLLILSLHSFSSVSIGHGSSRGTRCSRSLPLPDAFSCSHFVTNSTTFVSHRSFTPVAKNLQPWPDQQTSSQKPAPSEAPSYLRPLPTSLSVSTSVSKLALCVC